MWTIKEKEHAAKTRSDFERAREPQQIATATENNESPATAIFSPSAGFSYVGWLITHPEGESPAERTKRAGSGRGALVLCICTEHATGAQRGMARA